MLFEMLIGDIVVCGCIDVVFVDFDGGVIVVDWKIGKLLYGLVVMW